MSKTTEKITIKNFKAIKSAEIEVNQLVLLIGEQASGKSTIAKLIYFFKTINEDYLELIDENIETTKELTEDFLRADFFTRISKKFNLFFGSIQHLADFNICYELESDQKIELRTEPLPDGKRKKLQIELSPNLHTKVIKNMLTKLEELSKYSQQQDFLEKTAYKKKYNELGEYAQNVFNSPSTSFFIPAGRNVAVTYGEFFLQLFYGRISGDLELNKDLNSVSPQFVQDNYLMIRFLQLVRRILDAFKENNFANLITDLIDRTEDLGLSQNHLETEILDVFYQKIQNILKGKYQNDQYGEKIILDPDNDELYVHLRNASSGQQEVIRILQDLFLILVGHDSVFRVIEEPEAHLFPTAQKELLEMIAMTTKITKSCFLLTTHSPYILSVLNNILFRHQVLNDQHNQLALDHTECSFPSSLTAAYILENGQTRSILDPKTGLVSQNELDTISDILADEFDELYHLYAKQIQGGK